MKPFFLRNFKKKNTPPSFSNLFNKLIRILMRKKSNTFKRTLLRPKRKNKNIMKLRQLRNKRINNPKFTPIIRMNKEKIFPVIECIAKSEHNYIEEFVKYHLALGFKKIFIYDNEDKPTYGKLLKNYKEVQVIHFPGITRQIAATRHFKNKILSRNKHITHVMSMDIDEYILLKKHSNIVDFIHEYIHSQCEAIGINWKFFGDSGNTKKSNEPNTLRFTKCDYFLDRHIKTLYAVKNYIRHIDPHQVKLSRGHTKSTSGKIINGPFNYELYNDVIQINHYKGKTWEEFQQIRKRGRSDIIPKEPENVLFNFNFVNRNDVEDLSAYNFYKSVLEKN